MSLSSQYRGIYRTEPGARDAMVSAMQRQDCLKQNIIKLKTMKLFFLIPLQNSIKRALFQTHQEFYR
jgi:hypothetical protein